MSSIYAAAKNAFPGIMKEPRSIHSYLSIRIGAVALCTIALLGTIWHLGIGLFLDVFACTGKILSMGKDNVLMEKADNQFKEGSRLLKCFFIHSTHFVEPFFAPLFSLIDLSDKTTEKKRTIVATLASDGKDLCQSVRNLYKLGFSLAKDQSKALLIQSPYMASKDPYLQWSSNLSFLDLPSHLHHAFFKTLNLYLPFSPE